MDDREGSFTDIEIREGMDGLTPALIVALFRRAPLHRPVASPEAVWAMFERSSIVVTAWKGKRLIGLARVLTDGVLNSLLCDLAVEPDLQGAGVGKRLLHRVHQRCAGTDLLLRTRIARSEERKGLTRVRDAWIARPTKG